MAFFARRKLGNGTQCDVAVTPVFEGTQMPVFALYDFNDATTVVDDAAANGSQNGLYLNGATATGGNLTLDGVNDIAKIYPSPVFQMDRGTLEINFTPTAVGMTGPQTVLSRDSAGENQGSYKIQVYPDGSVQVTHEAAGASTVFSTGPGFYSPGDQINLSYSWDQGATDGKLVIENQTAGTDYTANVPDGLTMDMATQSQPWILGAGQSDSDPGMLNNIDQHFEGSVGMFSLSDSVDNSHAPDADPDVAETPEDTPVVIDVLANDTDPDGDTLTISGTPTAVNGTVTVNGDGTLTYTPNSNYHGTDTITYTVTDPSGLTSTTTVAVTVTPVNDAPDAVDDRASTAVDTPVTIAVLVNDTDVDGDTLSVLGTPTSPNGTVVANADGTITFTPEAGFTGSTVIEYQVSDGYGGTDTAQVVVAVGTTGGRDGIVTGTGGGDLIDGTYVDPTDGDRVDANDALIPGDGPNDDRIVAGAGNDTIYSGVGNDTIDAGTGDDLVYGGTGDDLEIGGAGNDTLYGGSGNDTLYGGAGNDSLTGGSGNDVVDGGEGDDFIDTAGPSTTTLPDRGYPGLYAADTDPNNDRDSVVGGAGNDTISTGDDADTIYGDAGNDYIDSGIDDDLVYGGTGNDTFVGSEGADTIYGEAGDDLIYGGLGPIGNDLLDLPDATDLDPDNNRDLLEGGDGNDTIYGRDDDDTMDGGAGNDVMYGGVDDDLMTGGTGDDVLNGDQGDDTLNGGAGSDTADGGDGNDYIDTSGPVFAPDRDYPGLYTADTDPNNDRDLVTGGAGNDTILTGDDADTIYGGAGDDSINSGIDDDLVHGGAGNDTVIGSEGADTIYGEAGDDLIYGGLGEVGNDLLDLPDATDLDPDNNRDLLEGGAGNDTIYGRDDDDTMAGGIGNDVMYGGVDDDVMDGNDGNDILSGDQGNDVIRGGAGSDIQTGGADRDVFIVGSNLDGIGDVIDGSETGDDYDVLDLSDAGPLRIVYDPTNPENGVVHFLDGSGNETGTLTFTNIENVIPCFTPGTLIATPRGEVPVESLRPGDRVVTRDNGIQQIRWVGEKALTGQELRLNSHLQPVFIKRGALGNGLPEQDMMVSPNHRLLVANDRTQLYFDEHEVLVAAKHMVGTQGIHSIEAISVSYIHFMFDRHEVVLSNGAWTESFQPGDYTLKGMGNAQRNEIFELFPDLKTEKGIDDFAAARRTLKRHEARLLAK